MASNQDAGGHDKAAYSRIVKDSLIAFLGPSAAQAVLFYIGEPDPATLEGKLRAFFGRGADTILSAIKNNLSK